jgi:predicted RecB family nuclease
MVKRIEDESRLQYKKQLAEFMATSNPKPTEEILEKLRQRYVKVREADETHTK